MSSLLKGFPGDFIQQENLKSIKDFESRPLYPVYPFIFLDEGHYSVREKKRAVKKLPKSLFLRLA